MIRITCYGEKEFNQNAAFLAFAYSMLFKQQDIDFYSYISIELSKNEEDNMRIFGTNTSKAFIFRKFQIEDYYIIRDEDARKKFLLSLLDETLKAFAQHDRRISLEKIDAIREMITQNNFQLQFIYKTFSKRNENRNINLLVCPLLKQFDFYLQVIENGIEKCCILIYQGSPSDYYIEDLFSSGKWKKEDQFILKGNRSEIEFHLNFNECHIHLENISETGTTPIFNMFRKDAGEKELKDYIASLNPSIAAIICQSSN